ncbi:hypothetical protein [Photobacterium damselae]|uniref:hypothetical protein n=1 Tax=Photobacterium damselae TaxID=38293 RepID=UPI001F241987|nr:hypothetical protein [Photobacterium damselae]UKA04010.1 hypothetical protein IHC89_15900 [Photobacterium damselae subsp. damselae]
MVSVSEKIEVFAHNYRGGAAIRNKAGQHLLVNSSWKLIVGDTKGISLKTLIGQTKDALVKTNIQHCQWCDDEVFHMQQPNSHLEVFAGKRYSVLRASIVYRGEEALLILVEPIELGRYLYGGE